MKIYSIYLMFFILSGQAWGNDLLVAQSIDDFLEIERFEEQMQRNFELCEYERQHSLFPVGCLVQLSHWLSEPGLGKKVQQLRIQVNRLCLNSTDQLTQVDQVKKVLNQPFLGKDCRAALIERQRDLVYEQG